MTNTDRYTFFSVDDHIVEPADVWTSRVPAKYREVAPHIIEQDDREYWAYEDRLSPQIGFGATAGKPITEKHHEPQRYSDMIRGCYDPVARASDLRSNNILASIGFPSFPRFAGTLFAEFKDKDLANYCVRAYNDFVIDEWCAAAPELYVPLVICQLWDPKLATKEVARCLDKGARSLAFVENPEMIDQPSFHGDAWDPLWALCEDAEIPVCLHIASGGLTDFEATQPFWVQAAGIQLVHGSNTLLNLLASPVPVRFPRIKIVLSEGGIGWIPSALERGDDQYNQFRDHLNLGDALPSEIFRRNFWVCMVEEPVGFKYRHDIGVDRILWESDYPHSATKWPHCQEGAALVFRDTTPEEVELVTHKNACDLFNWELSSPVSSLA
jgi:predicted TIM-barrel fold metal-dependent hydrolase